MTTRNRHTAFALLESLEPRLCLSATPMAPLDFFDSLGDFTDLFNIPDTTPPSTQPDTQPATQPDTTQPTDTTQPDTQPSTEPDTTIWDPGFIWIDSSTTDTIDTPDSPDVEIPAVGPLIQLEFNSRIIADDAAPGLRQGTLFAPVNVGQSSPANILTLRNTGDTPLNLGPIFTTTADFRASAPQNLTLNPDDTLSIALTFTPQDIGPRSGQLVIQSDAGNDSQFTVNLAGEGATLLFDTSYYLRANPDVAAAVSAGLFPTALDHFAQYGRYENRAPDSFFVPTYYAAHNPDVAAAVGDGKPFASLFDHFLAYGQEEGRPADPYYSESLYLSANPDVASALHAGHFNSGLEHLVAYGQFESRLFSPFFDQATYLSANPDVASAVASHALSSGWDHFIFYGQMEGRSPEGAFNESDYLVKNPDVAAAVAQHQFPSGFAHYLLYGRAEGRPV